jgi:hypothetical protein
MYLTIFYGIDAQSKAGKSAIKGSKMCCSEIDSHPIEVGS